MPVQPILAEQISVWAATDAVISPCLRRCSAAMSRLVFRLYGGVPYNRVMATAAKDDRLELRLTRAQKREIELAAASTGRSVTEFAVPLLVESARETIRSERELAMSSAAWSEFNAVLDREARSLDGLAELLRRPSVFVD